MPLAKNSPPRIAFLSAHVSGLVKLEYLLRHGFRPCAVISISPELAVKNKVAGYVDFRSIAEKHGIPYRCVDQFTLGGAEDLAYFVEQKFGVLLISGWQRIVPDQVLQQLGIGAIAEHGSGDYLPRGRGRAPIGWSMVKGQTRFVLHLFKASPGVDDGPVLDFKSFDINPHDTIATVYYKVGICSAQLFLRNQAALLAGSVAWKQEAKVEPTYFPKRTDADDFINWNGTTAEIHNHIRASSSPYPRAKARIGEHILSIETAAPFDQQLDFFTEAIGEILAVFPDRSLLVKTTDGTLLIKQYECDGAVEPGMCLV